MALFGEKKIDYTWYEVKPVISAVGEKNEHEDDDILLLCRDISNVLLIVIKTINIYEMYIRVPTEEKAIVESIHSFAHDIQEYIPSTKIDAFCTLKLVKSNVYPLVTEKDEYNIHTIRSMVPEGIFGINVKSAPSKHIVRIANKMQRNKKRQGDKHKLDPHEGAISQKTKSGNFYYAEMFFGVKNIANVNTFFESIPYTGETQEPNRLKISKHIVATAKNTERAKKALEVALTSKIKTQKMILSEQDLSAYVTFPKLAQDVGMISGDKPTTAQGETYPMQEFSNIFEDVIISTDKKQTVKPENEEIEKEETSPETELESKQEEREVKQVFDKEDGKYVEDTILTDDLDEDKEDKLDILKPENPPKPPEINIKDIEEARIKSTSNNTQDEPKESKKSGLFGKLNIKKQKNNDVDTQEQKPMFKNVEDDVDTQHIKDDDDNSNEQRNDNTDNDNSNNNMNDDFDNDHKNDNNDKQETKQNKDTEQIDVKDIDNPNNMTDNIRDSQINDNDTVNNDNSSIDNSSIDNNDINNNDINNNDGIEQTKSKTSNVSDDVHDHINNNTVNDINNNNTNIHESKKTKESNNTKIDNNIMEKVTKDEVKYALQILDIYMLNKAGKGTISQDVAINAKKIIDRYLEQGD